MPLIMLAASATLLLIVLIFKRSHALTTSLTTLFLAVCGMAAIIGPAGAEGGDGLFTAGVISRFAVLLIVFSAVVLTLLSYSYLESHDINKEEYYVMIVLGTLGASALAMSNHFITLLLGLELLSISIYIMTGYLRLREHVIEAAVKYLVLASVSSAFLIMGMALIYAVTGTMEFDDLGRAIISGKNQPDLYMIGGAGLMVVGIGFKMAVVPFHMWVADIYQGAPAHTVGFIASASKGAVVAVFLGFYITTGVQQSHDLSVVLTVLATLSMLAGNILALLQNNVKRILGYSSIAHFGYILIPFVSVGALSKESVAFYLAVYFISILGAFGTIIVLSGNREEVQELPDFRGLFWRKPWTALIFTLMLLSLAGIPATAGFMGKLYVLSAGIQAGKWLLSIVLIVSSVIGLFYYLRIVVEMFREEDALDSQPDKESLSGRSGIGRTTAGYIVLTLLLVLVIGIGLLPGLLSGLIQYVGIHP